MCGCNLLPWSVRKPKGLLAIENSIEQLNHAVVRESKGPLRCSSVQGAGFWLMCVQKFDVHTDLASVRALDEILYLSASSIVAAGLITRPYLLHLISNGALHEFAVNLQDQPDELVA